MRTDYLIDKVNGRTARGVKVDLTTLPLPPEEEDKGMFLRFKIRRTGKRRAKMHLEWTDHAVGDLLDSKLWWVTHFCEECEKNGDGYAMSQAFYLPGTQVIGGFGARKMRFPATKPQEA